jgi:hypothetical protein
MRLPASVAASVYDAVLAVTGTSVIALSALAFRTDPETNGNGVVMVVLYPKTFVESMMPYTASSSINW